MELLHMLTAVRTLWRRHRILFVGFIAAIAVTLFFFGRLLFFTVYWTDPDHRERSLEGWMTPGYVAHAYDLPPQTVRDLLAIDAVEGEPRTLEEIAGSSDLTLEEMQRRIDAAVGAREGGQD